MTGRPCIYEISVIRGQGFSGSLTVMKALAVAGLMINLKKFQFFKSKVPYLGFKISVIGIQPGTDKLRAIIDFPE